jgi:hypothetical protein
MFGAFYPSGEAFVGTYRARVARSAFRAGESCSVSVGAGFLILPALARCVREKAALAWGHVASVSEADAFTVAGAQLEEPRHGHTSSASISVDTPPIGN